MQISILVNYRQYSFYRTLDDILMIFYLKLTIQNQKEKHYRQLYKFKWRGTLNSKIKLKINRNSYVENVGYHECFAIMFRLERLRLYRNNINLINIWIVFFDRIMSGVPFVETIQKKTEYDNEFFETNRNVLNMYFEQMRSAKQLSK
ncbi:unnamed protein product [Paramecium primaurelia]|uniref:Uncharacterized protein n=1 Tax=Paramecium primaurelia TaxID=5886 RepID=A0A8S1KZ13_PARPR|nr:unnamed protein product [Paramecium primaurelia]